MQDLKTTTTQNLTDLIISTETLKKIVSFGALAPNSHNAQSWKINLDSLPNTIVLNLNPERLLPEIDPDNREAWISCGAFVQNVLIAASEFGYNAHFFIKNGKEIHIEISAKITYPVLSFDFSLLSRQQTTRLPYSRIEISANILKELTDLSSKINFFKRNSKEFKSIVKYSKKANRDQMRNKAKLKEMGKWIRFNDKKLHSQLDGMSLTELGVSGFAKKIIKTFFCNENYRDSKLWRNSIIIGQNALFTKCCGYLIIRSDSQQMVDNVQTGILMQKTWLLCTKHLLCVHPMSQVIEEIKYKEKLENELNLSDEIQMVIRLGYCKRNTGTFAKRRLKLV